MVKVLFYFDKTKNGQMKVIGIDMTQSDKPCSLAVLVCQSKKAAVVDIKDISDDKAILRFCSEADVVAIDSPLFLPLGLCCLEESCDCKALSEKKGRECERLLSRRGISSYYTTKRTFIKQMIYRSMWLASQIRSNGTVVIEVYPYASGFSLFGNTLPGKSRNRKDYYSVLAREMGELVSGISLIKSYDQADAVLAAYTGLLWCRGRAERIGSPDEGYLWMPSQSYRGDGDCSSLRGNSPSQAL